VTLAYFDANALVKLVVDEPGSDDAARLWDGADGVLSSRVAHPEVRAALAAARRAGRLDDTGARSAVVGWEELSTSLRRVEVTAEVETLSGELADRHALSGFDAIHLASALVVGGAAPVVLATWDRRLSRAANDLGVATLPA
jgi:predicted nucleic acid-binding protein